LYVERLLDISTRGVRQDFFIIVRMLKYLI